MLFAHAFDRPKSWGSLITPSDCPIAKIAKPIVETSVKVRQNLEKFVWSSCKK